MNTDKSIDLIIISGIVLLWVGTFFYLYPFMLWLIPSIVLGFTIIAIGCILIASGAIFIFRKSKKLKTLYIGISGAVLIVLWGIIYILAIFRF